LKPTKCGQRALHDDIKIHEPEQLPSLLKKKKNWWFLI